MVNPNAIHDQERIFDMQTQYTRNVSKLNITENNEPNKMITDKIIRFEEILDSFSLPICRKG
jgi:hypothetical protein